MPVNIVETETNKIDEATNALQFSTYFVIETVLFRIKSFISSHSSSDINLAAFLLSSHSQLLIFQTKPFSHF